MIKLSNMAEFLVDFSVPGTQSAATNKRVMVMPFACRLKAVYLKLGTAGTTNNQDVDINKNGTSIISSANKIRFATTAVDPTAGTVAFSTDPTLFSKGDILSLDVDAVHTTPAVNLGVLLVFERQRSGDNLATEVGTVGARNE